MNQPTRLKPTRRARVIGYAGAIVLALCCGYLDPYYFMNGH